eukprot:3327713-Pyramimonas_sp.AAC.2
MCAALRRELQFESDPPSNCEAVVTFLRFRVASGKESQAKRRARPKKMLRGATGRTYLYGERTEEGADIP